MPTLGELIARVSPQYSTSLSMQVEGAVNARITDVTFDSRAVRRGSIFCCVRGARHDGHQFAKQAVSDGAVAVVADHRLDAVDVPQILTNDTRRAMGHLAAAFYNHPSRILTVVGVTGTNGKTTTAHMLGAVMTQAGHRTTVLGTLSGTRTTPEAPELQRTLADEASKGTSAVVMEVSSHALALQRVAGMQFAAAIFTNLGHDHLDFHQTHDAYLAAKASLFSSDYTSRGVVNRDDPYGRKIADNATVKFATFGRSDATDIAVDVRGSSFSWRGARIRTTVGGDFNVLNALAAATAASELGISLGDIAGGLGNVSPISGRFENVNAEGEFAVLVDYAHTPEALRNVISAARQVAQGRVVVVFGCGGDRDASKRPEMGAAACAADQVIVTSDNPRSENPPDIITAIMGGVAGSDRGKVTVEIDRRRAIELACTTATRGDVVVIAGRGHETMQSAGGSEIAFSDAVVAREVLRGAR